MVLGAKCMKKFMATLIITAITMTTLAGCGSNNNERDNMGTAGVRGLISVVSREDGSGTRGAFVELFGVEEKDEEGNRKDRTTLEAIVVNSTEIVMSNVAGNPNAIGYISMGALNDRVKAVKINEAEASIENVRNGTYEIFRPFNIVMAEKVNEVTQDFIRYIFSTQGQAVIEQKGYISVEEYAEDFVSSQPAGKIVIAGSSSIAPVMEVLMEAYEEQNPNVEMELQTSDSTTGIQSVMDKTVDIGMASRSLKESETSLSVKAIALDGIAVIVNRENKIENMTPEEVKAIFTGEVTIW